MRRQVLLEGVLGIATNKAVSNGLLIVVSAETGESGTKSETENDVIRQLYSAARLLGCSKQKNLALMLQAYHQPLNVHSSHTKFRSQPASDFGEANCVNHGC